MSNHKKLFICRPVSSSSLELIKLLQKANYVCWHSPMITLKTIENPNSREVLSNYYEYVIFSSITSVKSSIELGYSFNAGQYYAIGESSALAAKRIAPNVKHSLVAGSEDLLNLLPPSLVGTSILLVQGDNARNLLASTLEQRGAIVNKLITYSCQQIIYPAQDFFYKWLKFDPQMLWITSVDILNSLMQQLQVSGIQNWDKLPCYTVSERVTKQAQKIGFKITHNVGGATNSSFINYLQNNK